jgi:hypothetical protein
MDSPESPNPDTGRWATRYASPNGTSAHRGAQSVHRLVVLGYITAVAMPPVGFIMGLVLAVRLSKPESRRGLWIIALSIVAGILWVIAIATGVVNPNSNTST